MKLRYVCSRAMVDYGEALFQSLAGQPVDDKISQLVLRALEPAALEISLQVAADVESDRQRLHQHWAKRLERTTLEVDRACRQYNAVEPNNRPHFLLQSVKRFAAWPVMCPRCGKQRIRPQWIAKRLFANWLSG